MVDAWADNRKTDPHSLNRRGCPTAAAAGLRRATPTTPRTSAPVAFGLVCLFSSALLCNSIAVPEVLYALEHDDPFKNRHAGKSRRRVENSGTRSILLQVLRTGWQSQF